MAGKRKPWPIPLVAACLMVLYLTTVSCISFFYDGHVIVDTFARAIWCSWWATLILFHLAWYIWRGRLHDRAKTVSVLKVIIFAIITIGGMGALGANIVVRDYVAAVPCVFWIVGAAAIIVVESRNQFTRQRNTQHEMIESLLGGDSEVSGSLAYTPYGSRTSKRSWYRHMLVQIPCFIISFILLFLGVLTVYGLAVFASDAMQLIPPGHFETVNVGGAEPRYRTDDTFTMHMYCIGDRTAENNFTIILEHGGGTGAVSMMPLQAALSNYTRVCVFDRPGSGWSQLDRNIIKEGDVPRETHQMLQQSGELPPYVFGGHSAGGGAALEFRELYPGEVNGIFFIDSYPLGDLEELWSAVTGQNFATTMRRRLRISDIMRIFAPLAIPRWFIVPGPGFPENLRRAQQWTQTSPQTLNAAYWAIRSMVELGDDAISVLPSTLLHNVTEGYLADLPFLHMAAVQDPAKTPNNCDNMPNRPISQADCEIALKIGAINWRIALAETRISTQGVFAPCADCEHSMAWDRVDWMMIHLVPWLATIKD